MKKKTAAERNPGSFNIEFVLGDLDGLVGMLDTGASVNVLPLNFYESSGLTGMKEMNAQVQLADGSTKSPRGIVEDVLVRVGRVHVMTDFVVMLNPDNFQGARYDTVLLGRPFVETMGLIINMDKRVATYMVNGKQRKMHGKVNVDPFIGSVGPVYVSSRDLQARKRPVRQRRRGKSSTQIQAPD